MNIRRVEMRENAYQSPCHLGNEYYQDGKESAMQVRN